LPAVLCDGDLSRVVLEITEHTTVEDYAKLHEVLRPLRERGMRLSIDDAGAGYSSFRHILRLRPDFIKLDISLTRDIDSDRGRRALAAALIGFARETGAELIAEGVETESELATLRKLGVHKAQGYLLGRPAPFETAQRLAGPSALVH
jgi:EAL domain-containing protein (putative c-di-GMP-specific phosphodiesterase class I)